MAGTTIVLIGCNGNGSDVDMPTLTPIPIRTPRPTRTPTTTTIEPEETMTNNESTEPMDETTEMIMTTLEDFSAHNAGTLARAFDRLEINVVIFDIAETLMRDDEIAGYIVRIEDDAGNVYYLSTSRYGGFGMFLYKDSMDGDFVWASSGSRFPSHLDSDSAE